MSTLDRIRVLMSIARAADAYVRGEIDTEVLGACMRVAHLDHPDMMAELRHGDLRAPSDPAHLRIGDPIVKDGMPPDPNA